MGFQYDLQVALRTEMINDPTLAAAVVGVYDHVPQAIDSSKTDAFPYIVIGDMLHDEFDTDSDTGFDVEITLKIVDRFRGRERVKQIQDALYSLLHRSTTLTIPNYNLVTIDQTQSFTDVENDTKTYYGVTTFRLLADEV